MGTWGKSLLENDLARDIYDTYSKAYEELNYEKAYQYTLNCYSEVINTDEEPVLWYTLAFAQIKKGHLSDEVRKQMVKWDSSDDGYSFLEDNAMKHKWKRLVTDLLKKGTVSDVGLIAKKEKAMEYVDNWCIGDIFAYKLISKPAEIKGWKNKFIVLQKIGNVPSNPTIHASKSIPIVRIVNYIYNDIYECKKYHNKNILPLVTKEVLSYIKDNNNYDDYFAFYSSRLNIALDAFKQSDIPHKRLYYITNDTKMIGDLNYKEGEYVGAFWTKMEEGWLIDCLAEWQM